MAATDVLSIEEARSAINVAAGVTTHDTELTTMNSAIAELMDELLGPIVARAVTEAHDGGRTTVTLDTTPVLSVTSVTEYDTDGTSTALTAETVSTKPASGYLLESDDHLALIHRRSSGADSMFQAGRLNVVVVTSAGRYADTAAVGARFKDAAKAALRAKWQVEAPRWAQTARFVDQVDVEEGPAHVDLAAMIRSALPLEQILPGLA